MNFTLPDAPWILLMLMLAFGFGMGGVFQPGQRNPAVPPKRARVLLAIALGIGLMLLFIGATYTRRHVVPAPLPATTVRVSSDLPYPGRPGTEIGPSRELISSETTSDTASGATNPVTRFTIPSAIRVWEPPHSARFRIIAVVLVGAVVLLAAWRRSSQARSVNVKGLAETRAGMGWLLVPAVCLGGLSCVAGPSFFPQPNARFETIPAISVSTQARMDKSVRDLLQSAAKPDGEGQKIPDWIKQQSPLQRASHLLSSGQYSTRQEAEEELLPIAADLLQRAFHQHHPWEGAWTVPLAQVRERVADQQYFEQSAVISGNKMYRLHMLVNVSREVCDSFTQSWTSQIVERRLKIFGVLLAWLTCVLMLGRAYFWSLTIPGNSDYWGSFLKASLLTVGLTVLAGWVLLEFIL